MDSRILGFRKFLIKDFDYVTADRFTLAVIKPLSLINVIR
jgi:hypothetical protein